MKVLITGHAGFIGTNLTHSLLQNGHQVTGIDNYNNYYSPKIKEYNASTLRGSKNFTEHKLDLLDAAALDATIAKEKPEAIVHLAAWAGVTRSIQEPTVYVRNNLEATVNLAESAVKHQVNSFVFASTSSIYGDKNKTPYKEDMNTDHPLAPYPATKKAGEVMLSTYNRNYGLNVTCLRIFNPLGPHQRPDLALSLLIRSCEYGTPFYKYQSGTARDYTYVQHLTGAIEHILQTPFGYEIFNMGNSSPQTVEELIATVEKVTGKKANIIESKERKGEMAETYADISKAKDKIGYNPTTTLEEMVEIYYKWYMEQENWYKKGDY